MVNRVPWLYIFEDELTRHQDTAIFYRYDQIQLFFIPNYIQQEFEWFCHEISERHFLSPSG